MCQTWASELWEILIQTTSRHALGLLTRRLIQTAWSSAAAMASFTRAYPFFTSQLYCRLTTSLVEEPTHHWPTLFLRYLQSISFRRLYRALICRPQSLTAICALLTLSNTTPACSTG